MNKIQDELKGIFLNQLRIDFLEEYTPESIVDEVRRIEMITKTRTITQKDVKDYGRISVSTIYKHFASLAEVAEKAGLRPHRKVGDTTKEDIVDELRRISGIIRSRPLKQSDIEQYSKISYYKIISQFKSLGRAVRAASLIPHRSTKHGRDDLLTILIDLWNNTLENEGRRPYIIDLKRYGVGISPDTYRRIFGGWKKALKEAYDYVSEKSVVEELPILTSKKTILKTQDEPEPPKRPSSFVERKPISIRKRFFVFKRDHFSCVFCGNSGVGVRLELDHKVPISKGGTDDLDNLQTLCFECNRGKRDSLER